MRASVRHAAAALLCLLLLCACGSAPAPAERAAGGETALSVYCFDAGKADAFLLSTKRSAVLIDCGEKGFGKEILAYMEDAGIERLDCLIVTHFDKDHVGGAAKVLNSVPVDTVLQSNRPKDSEQYEKYLKALDGAGIEAQTVRETLRFTLDGIEYAVDPPRQAEYSSDSSNNSSLIVSVRNGANTLLFTGDAEDERTAEFLGENHETYELLKLPHHGRWQSTLPALIASVKPAYAVITSSDEEPEDEETMALLAQVGVETYLTREGPVLFRCDGREIRVETEENAEIAA